MHKFTENFALFVECLPLAQVANCATQCKMHTLEVSLRVFGNSRLLSYGLSEMRDIVGFLSLFNFVSPKISS